MSAAAPLQPAVASGSAPAPGGAEGALPIRVHWLRSSYTAKANHRLPCTPMLLLALDHHPQFKTKLQPEQPHQQQQPAGGAGAGAADGALWSWSWDLSRPGEAQPVPPASSSGSGAALPAPAALSVPPQILVPLSRVGSAMLQVRQEDFSRQKEGDDLGGWSMPVAELLARAWRKDEDQTAPSKIAPASPPPAAAPGSTGTAAAPAQQPVAVAAAPAALVHPTPKAALADGWYSVRIDGASLVDRVSGRLLGELSVHVSLPLAPWLQYLLREGRGLDVLAPLCAQFLARPAADSPLRHVLLHPPSLRALVGLCVDAAADPASMDGERMRARLLPVLEQALDVWPPASQILDTLFADRSALWARLWMLRRCVPHSSLGNAASYAVWEGVLLALVGFCERVALRLEPPPPPPPRTAEQLEADAEAERVAAKRAALKEKKRRAAAEAAGEDPDDPEAGLQNAAEDDAEAAAGSGKKKKKSALLAGGGGGALVADPPAPQGPPSKLDFGLQSLDLLHELFSGLRVRLAGWAAFKRSQPELEWSGEAQAQAMVRACELLYRVEHFLFRFGSLSNIPQQQTQQQQTPPATPADGAPAPAAADPAAGVAAVPLLFPYGRMGPEEIRPLFSRDGGDPHALWLQKQLVLSGKKTKELLADNRELAAKLQAHADYFQRLYPLIKSTDKKDAAKSKEKH